MFRDWRSGTTTLVVRVGPVPTGRAVELVAIAVMGVRIAELAAARIAVLSPSAEKTLAPRARLVR